MLFEIFSVGIMSFGGSTAQGLEKRHHLGVKITYPGKFGRLQVLLCEKEFPEFHNHSGFQAQVLKFGHNSKNKSSGFGDGMAFQ